MSCQICVEVCPFEAIKMDTEFELATDDRFGGLLLDRKQLAKSNEYYHQIHPTEAAEVDARLAEEKVKADAKAKAAADAAAAKAAAARPRQTGPRRDHCAESRRRLAHDREDGPDLRSPPALAGVVSAQRTCRLLRRVLLSVVVIVLLFPALFALTTVFERKGLGRIQNRSAPIASGPSASSSPSPTASSR